jgi:hypothetical protein
MNFAAAAEELRRQEFARLSAAVTPRLEALSFSGQPFLDDLPSLGGVAFDTIPFGFAFEVFDIGPCELDAECFFEIEADLRHAAGEAVGQFDDIAHKLARRAFGVAAQIGGRFKKDIGERFAALHQRPAVAPNVELSPALPCVCACRGCRRDTESTRFAAALFCR